MTRASWRKLQIRYQDISLLRELIIQLPVIDLWNGYDPSAKIRELQVCVLTPSFFIFE